MEKLKTEALVKTKRNSNKLYGWQQLVGSINIKKHEKNRTKENTDVIVECVYQKNNCCQILKTYVRIIGCKCNKRPEAFWRFTSSKSTVTILGKVSSQEIIGIVMICVNTEPFYVSMVSITKPWSTWVHHGFWVKISYGGT